MALNEEGLAVSAYRASAPPDIATAPSPFDLTDLRRQNLVERLVQRLVDNPQWLFAILRRFRPIAHLPFTNWWIVTRFDDVQEILAHDRIFPVPFGDKVKALDGGPNFLLGMEADADYWRYQKQLTQAFKLDDVAKIVAPLAGEFARQIIDGSGGRLDAVQNFITLVPTKICERYYGVPIADDAKVAFGQWMIAMSNYMFGDPTDKPAYRRVALAAGERVRPLVDRAILGAKAGVGSADTVLARLIEMQRAGAEGLTAEIIRTFLIGMITGFVPTNTMAAGHILEILLRRPDFMRRTRAAALAGDDELLKRCLFEAMRFKPLNPGPMRNCAADYTIAAGTPRATRIRKGAKLLAGTQSAMFDERRVIRPNEFNPNRPASNFMLFGYGLHWCLGAFIAEVQITQTLKALLLTKGLRRAPGKAGQLHLLGPFPEHLVVEFADPRA
jgi:cytochrome P450